MWPRKQPSVAAGVSESQQALNISRVVLNRVKARDPSVERVTRDMLRIREHNHFAEQLNILMANRRKGFLGERD